MLSGKDPELIFRPHDACFVFFGLLDCLSAVASSSS
jgi:hypothetical protein